MTEFLNYTVDLFLKDGSKSSGIISAVDASQITLSNAHKSDRVGDVLPSMNIPSSMIADLKVIKLPNDLIKNLKKRSKDRKEKPKGGNKKKDDSFKKEESIESSDKGEPVKNDFDFEANLAMFDKKSIFEDFKNKDKIKPKDRLVGHNKVENIRKDDEKFKNDEMVLDKGKIDLWDSIGNIDKKETIRNMSVTGRSTPIELISPNKSYSFVNAYNNINIPVCSPIQLSDIERISSETFLYNQDLMSETFATNLSSYITNKILGGSSRLNSKNHNLPPLVLLLIGSERCSSRSFAIGRHLSNHGVRVLAYSFTENNSNDETFNKQQEMFQKAGGKVLNTSVKELINILSNQLDTPVELIIESLQGYDDHLEDIFYQPQEQDYLKQLIHWCNHKSQSSRIMSLDIPAGIDGGSGTLTDHDLLINGKWIVSMGLPIAGIIHGYNSNWLKNDDDNEIIHLLVDIGVPNSVYQRKSNLRRFDKVWYTSDNVITMKLIEKIPSEH